MDSALGPPVIVIALSVAVDRETGAESTDLAAHLSLDLGIAVRAVLGDAVEHVGDEVADLAELGNAEATRRPGRRPQAHAGSHGEFLRIARNAVLVDRDAGAIEHLLGRDAGGFLRT